MISINQKQMCTIQFHPTLICWNLLFPWSMIAFSTTSKGYVSFQDLSKYSMWDISCQNYGAESLEFLVSHCLMQHANHHVWWTSFKFTKRDFAVCYNKSASIYTIDSQRKISCSEGKHDEWCVHACMHAQKRILFTYSWDLHGQRNKTLPAKLVLILIPYYLRSIRMAVQMLSI